MTLGPSATVPASRHEFELILPALRLLLSNGIRLSRQLPIDRVRLSGLIVPNPTAGTWAATIVPSSSGSHPIIAKSIAVVTPAVAAHVPATVVESGWAVPASAAETTSARAIVPHPPTWRPIDATLHAPFTSFPKLNSGRQPALCGVEHPHDACPAERIGPKTLAHASFHPGRTTHELHALFSRQLARRTVCTERVVPSPHPVHRSLSLRIFGALHRVERHELPWCEVEFTSGIDEERGKSATPPHGRSHHRRSVAAGALSLCCARGHRQRDHEKSSALHKPLPASVPD